jgi:2-polyprenyl-3-methyl-5-hydroxy-6-metoxy-1,4-benzoquinol methylase
MSLASKLSEMFHGKPAQKSRFSLHSGERQTGLTLETIRHDHVARYRMVAEAIIATWDKPSALYGLDVFCATGYGARLIADTLFCPILGIDASEEAIAIANAHFSSPFNFYATKTFPFHLPRRAFDFVICLESIEHVADCDEFLVQTFGSLKAGGKLYLSTPNSAIWSLDKNPNPFHHRHFTRQEVIALVQRHAPRSRLVEWYGQNLYRMQDGHIVEPLPSEEMQLNRAQEGQILLFEFTVE